MKRILLTVYSALALAGVVKAQEAMLKTNALYWAERATINAAAEIPLSAHWSFDLSGAVNPWNHDADKKMNLWMVQPEVRYWLREHFNRSFFAVHLLGGENNFRAISAPFGIDSNARKYRYEGWFVGAGLGYGYTWPIAKHWSLEGEVAVGYIYADYKRYRAACGKCKGEGTKHYVAPTKLSFNIIYAF